MKLAAIILLLFGAILYFGLPHSFIGKEVFNTKQEYQEFKLAISKENVHINNIEIVNDNIPIIVEFSIKADEFPYGDDLSSVLAKCLAVGFFGISGIVAFILSFGKDIKN